MNNKTTFRPRSILEFAKIFLFLAFGMALICGSLTIIVRFVIGGINAINVKECLYLAAFLIVLIGVFYKLIYIVRHDKIVFDKSELFVDNSARREANRLQFETHIKYVEVTNIFISVGDMNSRGQTSMHILTPMPYLVFECKGGEQKTICVYYYTKKQVIKIVDLFAENCRVVGNILNIGSGVDIVSALYKK